MNEEETSDTFKLGAKEYDAPLSVNAKFLSLETLEAKMNFGSKSQFWETISQETLSPPPEHS